MTDIAAAFAQILTAASGALGAGYWPARIVVLAEPVFDDGGSLIPGSGPTYIACNAQVDAATEAMRATVGFTEEDRRVLVLSDGVSGIDSDNRLEITSGPFIGAWSIQSVTRDPAAIYFELRARPA